MSCNDSIVNRMIYPNCSEENRLIEGVDDVNATTDTTHDLCELFDDSVSRDVGLNDSAAHNQDGGLLSGAIRYPNDLFRGDYPDFDDGVYELKVTLRPLAHADLFRAPRSPE